MRLGCFMAITSLLVGCGGDLEGEVGQQSYRATSNDWVHYLQVNGNTIAEIDRIEIDGQDVPLEAEISQLNTLMDKTAILHLKSPGLACGVLVKTLGAGNPTIGPGSQSKHATKITSVISLKRDSADARRWNVTEAFPENWDPGEYTSSSNRACENVVAKMGAVELG